jgi:hypothetical protein
MSAKESDKALLRLTKLRVDAIPVYLPDERPATYPIASGVKCYVDLRSWSESGDFLWYYDLDLPQQHDFQFVVLCEYGAFQGRNNKRIEVAVPIFHTHFFADAIWISSWGLHFTFDPRDMCLVDEAFVRQFPHILPADAQGLP